MVKYIKEQWNTENPVTMVRQMRNQNLGILAVIFVAVLVFVWKGGAMESDISSLQKNCITVEQMRTTQDMINTKAPRASMDTAIILIKMFIYNQERENAKNDSMHRFILKSMKFRGREEYRISINKKYEPINM